MKNKRRLLAIVLFIIPILFFVIAYLLMSMSGEDVIQANLSSEKNSFFELIGWVYSYIPRIGEFIAWPAASVMSYQTTFGLDLLIRMVDIVCVISVIYLLSFMILKRRLHLRLFDAGIFNIVFLMLVLIPQLISPLFGNPFLSGFSFIHNYVTMSLIAILFTLPYLAPFLKIESDLKILKNPFVSFILGFLFAISTELLPVSFIATIVLYCLFKKFIAHEKIEIKKWQIFGLVGIIAGLGFFYLGGGLSARTGFTYAETYDYVSLSSIFSAPRYFVSTYLKHFISNIKYIMPIICFSILAITTYKIKRNKNNGGIIRQLILMDVFSIIYVLGASLILLDDAITVRFLLPCYLLFVLNIGLYVRDYHNVLFNTSYGRLAAIVVVAIFSIIVTSDMVVGKVKYATRTSRQLAEIVEMTNQSSEEICLTKAWATTEAGPVYSPIFSFTQEPIFEPWNVKTIYGHEIRWAEIGEEDICNN